MGTKHPTEIWALRHPAGHLIGPALDDDKTQSFLAWPIRTQAEIGRIFQEKTYDLEGLEVVQLLAPPEQRYISELEDDPLAHLGNG